MNILFDTSACIEILRGNRPPESCRNNTLFLSSIVETEIWAGLFYANKEQELSAFNMLVSSMHRLNFDTLAAKEAGKIHADLIKSGEQIGDFDTLIAGHAISSNSVILTKNIKHFKRIKDLEVIPF